MAGQLTALAADEHLRPLWKAVHERLSRGGVSPGSVVTVTAASPEVVRAVDRLLGRVSSPGQLRVPLRALDSALAHAGTSAATVAALVHGPIVDRRLQRSTDALQASDAWSIVLAHPAATDPALADWLERIRNRGRLQRVGGADALLAALRVLEILPLNGDLVGRNVLAAAVLGREHDLDEGTPIGRLVTAGLAARLGTHTPVDAAGRASLWAGAGVTLDAVSTAALTLGLRPKPVGPLTSAASTWAESGIALPIPAAAVAAELWHLPADRVVFVCENPSVLEAAAAQLGPGSPPLVCVSGMPGRAVTSLLTQLSDGGARLRYHGDFGAGGITIANVIIGRHHAEPWRMSTDDHVAASEGLAALGRVPTPLRGRIPEATWDPDLARSIRHYGGEITEEHVLDDLLGDLTSRVDHIR